MLKKTEHLIISILWCLLLITLLISWSLGLLFSLKNAMALTALTVVTIILYLSPKQAFKALFVLLLLGTFNLLEFAPIGFAFTFGFQGVVSPGIQLVSLAFLFVLILKRSDIVKERYAQILGVNGEKKVNVNTQNRFIQKFEKLSDDEIDRKLQEKLVPEAIHALQTIKDSRK